MKYTTPIRTLLAVLGVASAVGAANAATVVETENYNFTPAGTAVLNFNKFNTSLGTLTNVTISWSLTKQGGSLFVDNDSLTPGSGQITQTVAISLASTDVALTNGTFQAIGTGIQAVSAYTASVTADDGDGAGYQPGGADNDGTFFGTTGPVTGNDNVNSLVWSQYSGPGTFNINANGSQSINVNAISGVSGSFTSADAVGSVTVTYTYEAVPEPSAALLGCLGALGLVVRRRR